MQAQDILAQARDTLTVKRVFGEPIERDGVTVIPVANVAGGAGGGGESGSGSGGFGLRATPAGVYVIKDGKVDWQPAVDVNRAILGGQIVAIVLFLTIRGIIRSQARARLAPTKRGAQ